MYLLTCLDNYCKRTSFWGGLIMPISGSKNDALFYENQGAESITQTEAGFLRGFLPGGTNFLLGPYPSPHTCDHWIIILQITRYKTYTNVNASLHIIFATIFCEIPGKFRHSLLWLPGFFFPPGPGMMCPLMYTPPSCGPRWDWKM